jgi:multidrug efflux system membrane fusion protein
LAGEDGFPHKGHVQAFDNHFDTASGTIRARAILDNKDGALVPGLFARIRVGSPQKVKALLITDHAVGTDQDKKFVYVVGEGNKAQYREVELDGMAEGLRIVSSGLKAGEKIIVSGLQRARPGAPVVPQPATMDKPDVPPPGAPQGAGAAAGAETPAAGEEQKTDAPQDSADKTEDKAEGQE